jgi:hypothetical protein
VNLVLYSRGGTLNASFRLVSRISDEEWAEAKQKAIQYFREHESSILVAPEQILDFFQLWRGANYFNTDVRLLYREVKLGTFKHFEAQHDNPVYRMTYFYVAEALRQSGLQIEFIAVSLDPADEISCVSAPNLSIRSEALNRALSDAEKLVETNGAASGVDRAHTLFHGYLQLVCEEAAITFDADAPVTTLFRLLREKHPKLQTTEPEVLKRMTEIHRGMARVIDALSPLRNESSLAHPNKLLISDAEAMLVINCIRSIMHYLNSKLRAAK